MIHAHGGVLMSNKVNNFSVEMSVCELLPCRIAGQYSLKTYQQQPFSGPEDQCIGFRITCMCKG